MKTFIFPLKNHRKYYLNTLSVIVALLAIGNANAQTYLTGIKTANFYNVALLGTGSASISTPPMTNYVYLGDSKYYYAASTLLNSGTTTPVALKSYHFTAVAGLTGGDTYVQFRNTTNSTIPAGTPTYFRLKERPVNVGLNVNLGAVLGIENFYNIKGSMYKTAGDYEFDGTGLGYSGDENVGTTITNDNLTDTKLLIDKNNEWVAKVTPPTSEAYNSVRLKVALPAGINLVSASSVTANVYNAYTLAAGDVCSNRPLFTNYGNTGINISAGTLLGGLDLSQLVGNAYQAIDDSPTTYSSFNSGLASIGVASTVSQGFFFDRTATSTESVKIHLAISQAAITAGVLSGNITFQAYKGNSTVGTAVSLANSLSLLGLNLLNIVTVGGYKDVNVSFAPGADFDRIEVQLSGLVSVGVIGDVLRIFDASLAPIAPVLSKSTEYIFSGTQPTAIASTTIAGDKITWLGPLPATTVVGTSGSASPYRFPTNLTANGSYAAVTTKGTCTIYSDQTALNVIVVTDASVTIPKGISGKALTTGGIIKGTSPDHTFTFTETGAPAGVSFNATTGAITATTLPTVTTTTTYPITVTILENGVSTGLTLTKNLVVYPALVANNGTLPFGIENTTYGAAHIPTPTGGSGAARTYALQSGTFPPGLSLNTDGSFSGQPTTDGSYSFVIRITDTESGEFIDQTYSNVKVYDQLVASPTVLPNSYEGAPTYNAASIPVPTGGSGEVATYTYVKTIGTIPTGLTVNSAGVVSGTTTTPGTYSFTIVVSDPTSGQTISQPYVVIVSPKLVLPGGTFPSVSISLTTYSKNISQATNGTTGTGIGTGGKSGATLVYSLTAPGARTAAIPTSFTLASNGDLTGNPSSAGQGTNTFSVFVTDGEQTTQNTYTVQITGPLPVTLTSFTASKEGQVAQLKWSTTEETNSDRFEIERSQNGKNWDLIGTQVSNGESTSLKNYNFSDAKPLNGENLYRLKMIDKDATYAYSRIQSLTFDGDLQTSFYPNPVAEKLIIETANFALVKSVKIFDANGKTVYQSSTLPTNQINVQNLSAGLYIVQVISKSGAVISHKVIKQ